MRLSERLAGPVAVMLAVAFVVAFVARAAAQTAPAVACERLAEQRLSNTTISAAQTVAGGSFTPSGSTNAMTNLPPFCRVAGVIAPTADSQIVFEVWLPLQNWNGKFAGVGNGGWAGSVSFGALGEQLRRGYATASTNTGHEGAPGMNAARFAFEKPEQLIDFAYRSHHETAVQAKALAQAFYGKGSRTFLFHRVLVWRIRGPHGGAAVSDRLRRHRRRGAGEQLDAAHGG